MKLNKWQKQAFVEAIMQDIPSVDYEEQFRSYITKGGLTTLPKEILAIHNDPKLIGYLEKSSHRANKLGYVYYYAAIDWKPGESEAVLAYTDELAESARTQSIQRSEIKEKIKAVIASCSTLKQAETLLPEFIKYLPKDTSNLIDRSMPVITDLVVTLTAAGWPKDGKETLPIAA